MSRSNIYNNNIDSISILLNQLIVRQKDQKCQKDKHEEDLNTSFISEYSSIDSLLKRLVEKDSMFKSVAEELLKK